MHIMLFIGHAKKAKSKRKCFVKFAGKQNQNIDTMKIIKSLLNYFGYVKSAMILLKEIRCSSPSSEARFCIIESGFIERDEQGSEHTFAQREIELSSLVCPARF